MMHELLPDRKKVMETLRARRMTRLLPERYDLNRPLVRSNCCLLFVFVRSLSFLCPLWSLSLEWPRTRSGLLWRQADRALGHIQNGGSESPCGCSCRHPRSRHLSRKRQSDERQVLCKTWSPNRRSLLANVEAWNASNLTVTNFKKYQIKLLVCEHVFQENYLIKFF